MTERPIGIGILGAAGIAERAIVDPARWLDGVRVIAIGARDPGRARTLADRLGVPESGDYEMVLNHPDIEPKIPAALREAIPLVASGAIQVPIAATYRLSSLREAVLHAQRGGKVLLDLRRTT